MTFTLLQATVWISCCGPRVLSAQDVMRIFVNQWSVTNLITHKSIKCNESVLGPGVARSTPNPLHLFKGNSTTPACLTSHAKPFSTSFPYDLSILQVFWQGGNWGFWSSFNGGQEHRTGLHSVLQLHYTHSLLHLSFYFWTRRPTVYSILSHGTFKKLIRLSCEQRGPSLSEMIHEKNVILLYVYFK